MNAEAGNAGAGPLEASARERMYAVLVEPHVTEKASVLGDQNNQYAFKVAKGAKKREIKAAVETIFGVSVLNVTTLNQRGKTRRTVRGMARRKGWKKAYVRLAEGHEIDFAAER